MKRFLVILLVLVLTISMIATAEETAEETTEETTEPVIDLSGYTVDELILIQKNVADALYEKGGKVVLPVGKYTVGVDIAAGTYNLEVHNFSDTSSRIDCGNITIWKSNELKEQYDKDKTLHSRDLFNYLSDGGEYPAELATSTYTTLFSEDFYNDSVLRITLEEGNILEWEQLNELTFDLTIEKAQSGFFMD